LATSSNDTAGAGTRQSSSDLTSLLYTLTLNRVRIATDMRVRGNFHRQSGGENVNGDLRGAMFHNDQLLVSTERLSQSASQSDFYVALQDVLANVVGAEHFGLFERDLQTQGWRATAHCGATSEALRECVNSEAFFAAFRTRDMVSANACESHASRMLNIPMLDGLEVVAILVIFEWLPQQTTTAERDAENVIEMLKVHGGTILRSASERGMVED
jgi:hypothetical protein